MQDNVCALVTFSLATLSHWFAKSKKVLVYPHSGLEISALMYSTEVWVISESLERLARSELCAIGLQSLKKDGFETLFGMNLAGRRVFLYHQLRTKLTPQGCMFWDAHEVLIREGLMRDAQLSNIIHHCGLGHSALRWKFLAPYFLERWAHAKGLQMSGKELAECLVEHKDSWMIRVLRQWCISAEDVGIRPECFSMKAEMNHQWRMGKIEEVVEQSHTGWDAVFWGDRIEGLSDAQRVQLWNVFRRPIWKGSLMAMVSYQEVPSWIEEVSHWKTELCSDKTLFYKSLILVRI